MASRVAVRHHTLVSKPSMESEVKRRHDSGYSSPSDDWSPSVKQLTSQVCRPSDKFLIQGYERQVLLESIILDCVMRNVHATPFARDTKEDVVVTEKLLFAHDFGDLFTTLNMVRAWCNALQRKQQNQWYTNHSFDPGFFKAIERSVEQNFTALQKTYQLQYDLKLNKQLQEADEQLQNMVLEKLSQNVCMYLGHPVLGYMNVKTSDIVDIDRNSVFHMNRVFPKVITFVTCHRETANCVTSFETFSYRSYTQLVMNMQKIQTTKAVAKVVYETVGQRTYQLFREIWDSKPTGGHMKVSDSVAKACDNTNVITEYDAANSMLCIFALPKYKQYLGKVVADILHQVRRDSINIDQRLVMFPSEESGCRLQMAPGAMLSDILFPDDTKVVNIHETRKGMITQQCLNQWLKRYPGVKVTESVSKSKRDENIWGQLEFQRAEDVEPFLCAMKMKNGVWFEKKLFAIDTYVTRPLPVSTSRCFKFHVSVNRRGLRYSLKLTDAQYKEVIGVKSLRIAGKGVKLKTLGSNTIQLAGVKGSTTAQDVREAFEGILDIRRKQIQSFYETSTAEREELKQELLDFIADKEFRKKMTVIVEYPKSTDSQLCAEIKCNGIKTGYTILKQMEREAGRSCQRDFEFSIHSAGSFQMTPPAYHATKTAMYMKMQNVNTIRPGKLCIKEERTPTGDYILYLSSETVWEAEEMYLQYSNMFEPVHVDFNAEQWKYLSSIEGQIRLDEIQQMCNSYIYTDNQDMCAYVYGSKPAKTKTRDLMRSGPEDTCWRAYSLEGPGKPGGFAGHVVKRLDCPDMTRLLKGATDAWESGHNKSYKIHMEKNCLLVKASFEAFHKVCSELDMLLVESEVECVACCCSVEGSVYVTETCGHAYCYGCMTSQMRVAVENRFYPIRCAMAGCEHPLSWQDINNICDCRGSLNKVLNISLSLYIAQGHSNRRVKFCPTANCHGIYLESCNSGAKISCFECKVDLCAYCTTFWHSGINCQVFQANLGKLGNIDTSVKTWMALNMDNRKICPNCKMGIEKSEGCNNVNCRNCQRYVCWKCLLHFEKGHECYDHLRSTHGGLFDD